MAETSRTSSRRRARRRQRRRALVLGLAAVLVAGGAGTAWAMTRSSGPSYRLAEVTRTDVGQSVDADGTIATINQAALSFATTGTVAAVRVSTGDEVQAGQIVATLDTSDLQAAVVSAKQAVADAKQRLADDESAQTSTATTASVTTATSTIRLIAAVSTTPPRRGGGNSAVAAVKQAQQLVEKAQHELDNAVSDQDITTINTSCVETDGTPATVSATADANGNVAGTVGKSVMTVNLLDANGTLVDTKTPANGTYSFPNLTPGSKYQVQIVTSDKIADTAACTAALKAVRDKAAALAAAKRDVSAAVAALTKALTALQSSSNSGGGSSTPTGGKSSGAPSRTEPTRTKPTGSTASGSTRTGTPSGTGAAGGNSTTTVTAEQIVADQKAIDASQAQVLVAERNRGLAVLRAPITGVIADLSIAKGDSVSTSTSAMSVVGSGRKSVQVNVSLADVDLVKGGQTAHVTVDGLSDPLPAKVTQVGLTNTSSSTGSSSTYAVTIALQQTGARLYDGMGASVSIDVGTAKNALSVPSSAVHTTGSFSTVEVYAKGKVTTTRVTVGVKGSDQVQITSGLKPGQHVVLAVVSAPIPSTDSSTRTGRFGGGGLTSGLGGGAGPAFVGGGPGR